MYWLEGALNFTGQVFRSLNVEVSPTNVIQVKSDKYSDRIIRCREDSLVLYGPCEDQYEIVLHRPCHEMLYESYSLFRSKGVCEAETKFLNLKDKVPPLVETSKQICNVQGIQKICDILEKHQSWTVVHVAAHLGLNDCIKNPIFLSHLNDPDVDTGMSALQVAIQSGNLQTVQSLIAAKASTDHVDHDGNTVFHYASSTTKEIISALASASTQSLNLRNAYGHTPLHDACLADKSECVKALLLAGADVNISVDMSSPLSTPPGYVRDFLHDNPNKLRSQDMKYGGSPLHWSCSREVINTLLDVGCHINTRDFRGRTALHVAVEKQQLDCVVALLSRQADINICDHNGNTALHLGVQGQSLAVVQALLVFDADLNCRNKEGATPRHCVSSGVAGDNILWLLHSVGAKRCGPNDKGCKLGCSSLLKDAHCNGTPPAQIPSATPRNELNELLDMFTKIGYKKGARLLCLDGGGIRGLLLTVILLELEKAAQQPIIHCFDWIAGTSTGGILALGLAQGKTLKECLCLYFRMKDVAFVGRRPYSSEPLEEMLKECLGTTTVMADISNPKLIITGVLADRKPVDLHLFRNYESPSSILNVDQQGTFVSPPLPQEQLLWKAARATGAAPSYFRAFGRYLDGGLIANNPTLDALTEIHEYNLALRSIGRESEVRPLSVVVSLGTGLIPVSQLNGIDIFRPENLWDTAKLAFGISALGNLLVDQATASDGRVVDRARAWCSMIGVPYFRFSPQMSQDIAMDERSDEKLVCVLWEAKAYMYSNRNNVKKVASFLNSE